MKEEAERDLLTFVKMMWPILEPEAPFEDGWVIDLLCDVLTSITDGYLKRVCINVPPGSMKSTLLNVMWPAWEWIERPDYRYVSISYSDKVPTRDNLRLSTVVRSPLYQQCWGDRVKLVQDGAEMVRNDRTGWKMVTGTSGSVTGFRGDRLLLDDLNNPENVESDVVRMGTERFVREIMPSRINDLRRSAIINLQQRTHEMDATGVLLKYMADAYTFVCVPAEFDPLRLFPVTLRWNEKGQATDVWVDPRGLDDDGRTLKGIDQNERGEPTLVPGSPMAKVFGETFWPERFPETELATLKRGMTPYSWDSQFNQYPGIRGGALIRRDWWKLWRGDYPDLGTVIVSLDTAIEEKNYNDYNACTVWGAFAGLSGEPLLLLLAAWHERLPLAQLVAKVADTCRGVILPGSQDRIAKADYLLIEHKTRGRDVHDEIIRLYQERPWETVLVTPDGSKIGRLKAVEHLFSGDYQRLPTGLTGPDGKPEMMDNWTGGIIHAPDKDWADVVINQVASFPYAEHDDYVDTVSQAVGWVRKNGVVLRKEEWEADELRRNTYRKPLKIPYAIMGGNFLGR